MPVVLAAASVELVAVALAARERIYNILYALDLAPYVEVMAALVLVPIFIVLSTSRPAQRLLEFVEKRWRASGVAAGIRF